MADPQIQPLVLPSSAEHPPSWQVQAVAEVEREDVLQTLGNDDLAQTAEQINASLALQQQTRKEVLLALDPQAGAHPAAVLGTARLALPLSDNTHTAMLELTVRPEHRRRGVGEALWRATANWLRDTGRTHVLVVTNHPDRAAAGAVHAMTASPGGFRVDANDPGAVFALTRGFALAQVERHSVQTLPLDPEWVAALQTEAAAAAGDDYDLLTWTGPVPQEWVEQVVSLLRAMSTDIPLGNMNLGEEVWDAERLRREEQVLSHKGRCVLTAAVRHVPSGDLAGYTQIHLEARQPQVAHQENTLVLRDHRGHRLGMLLKAANLAQLQEQAPAVRRVHTWNADENEHMLAINTALGYRHTSTWANWQLRLDRAGTEA